MNLNECLFLICLRCGVRTNHARNKTLQAWTCVLCEHVWRRENASEYSGMISEYSAMVSSTGTRGDGSPGGDA